MNDPSVGLRLLVVEHSEPDAILLLDALAQDGFVVSHQRVETASQLRTALSTGEWDCIVTDFSLPSLQAPQVLRMVAERGIDVPCIVVSGTIGEDTAVEVLTSGASDFLLKGRLARLGPAIRRELRESSDRRTRRHAEAALRESEQSFRALFVANPFPMWVFDSATLDFLEVNGAAVTKYGYSRDEFLAMQITAIRPPDEVERLRAHMAAGRLHPMYNGIWRHRLRSGEIIRVEVTSHTLTFAGRNAILVAAVDCTARVSAQEALEARSRADALTADVGVALSRSDCIDSCLLTVAQSFTQRLAAVFTAIWTISRSGDALELRAAIGAGGDLTETYRRVALGSSPIGVLAQRSEPRVISLPTAAREEIAPFGPSCTGAAMFASYPLRVKERLVGVLALSTKRPMDQAELTAMNAIADHLALGIERYATDAASRQLAAIVAYSDDPILSLTVNGVITTWNAGAERLYGYTAEEAVGQPLTLIIPPELPDELNYILGTLQHGAHLKRHLTVRRRKDGSRVPMSLTLSPIKDASGRAIGVSSIGSDISERLRAEETLRNTEERMRFALAAAQVGIWEADMVSNVSRWSEICEALHGLSPGSFDGTFDGFLQTIHPDDRERVLQTIETSTRDHTDSNLLYRTVWPDGTMRWISGTGRSHYDDAGAPVRAAGIAFDVTERQALQAQFMQSQKMEAIGQLAGGVAHDFNNLLTAILGYSSLVLDRLDPIDPLRTDVKEIIRAGESAATLTRQLLAFGRRQVMQPKVTTVNAIVADVERLLARLIGENVRLVSRLRPDLHPVRVDPVQIEQVLINLAVNARDAMPDGGTLTIETTNVDLDEPFTQTDSHHESLRQGYVATLPGSYVQLSVSDTGIGMDAAVQARLFEPFFTTKPTGKGTGLGLATVYGIVKQSQGQIYVHSEVGRGSVFKIYLPVTADRSEPATPVKAAPAPLAGSETILLVEDNDAARRLARAVLVRHGYRVLEAASGEEALSVLRAETTPIDLVLTDIIMTGITGIELARRLTVSYPHLRVLMTSGYSNDVTFRDEERMPGIYFLEKPYTPTVLTRTVRKALDDATNERSPMS